MAPMIFTSPKALHAEGGISQKKKRLHAEAPA
jgi:hypothetical protein